MNWGIPDWTDECAYGDVSRWSEYRWRWEFTRRRSDCRADFRAHKDETARFFDCLRALEIKRSPGAKRGRLLRPDEPGFTAQVPNCYEKYGLNSAAHKELAKISSSNQLSMPSVRGTLSKFHRSTSSAASTDL